MYRVVPKYPKFVVQKRKRLIYWVDVKEFESRLKALKYISNL